jgi:glycosyltransferase involved in cell wall biosynthesis
MPPCNMPDNRRKSRPGLAIVANCLTPYRVNLHRLIVLGIPELQLHTIVSHGAADFDWELDKDADVNVQYFGAADHSPLSRIHHAPLREWRKGGEIIRYIREYDVRAVICGLPRYLSYLRLCVYCQKHRIPFFVHSDANIRSNNSISTPQKLLKKQFHSWWVAKTSGIWSMGEWGDEYFRLYGAKPADLYRVTYTPDYDYFAQVESHRLEEFRRKHGLKDGRRRFLYSGRLAPVKRVDLLVDAFVEFARERDDWDLLVVGSGPLESELRRRVPEPLRNRVIWVGFLQLDDIVAAYHSADVLVLPSDREPWAVVVQEAMAAGLAVVASDVVGAAHELVEEGRSGRIFPHGDAAALQSSLLDISSTSKIDSYKREAIAALAQWRLMNDPITEIRRALKEHNALPE